MSEESLDAADPLDPNDALVTEAAQKLARETLLHERQSFLRSRREAYVRLFSSKPMAGDAAIVLADLKLFCRGGQTPWDPDQRVHALLTGRFEVYSRVIQHLTMGFDELWELYNA